jgi:hypothetical protein
MTPIRASVLVLAALLAACGGSEPSPPTTPSPPPSSPPVSSGFVLQGDPESAQGATWTYRGSLDGVTFDLQGILLKPTGAGPFGAVIISHGAGGNVGALPRTLAIEMRRWRLVGIATNYTPSAGVPIGVPGTANDPGASEANVWRGHAVREILRTLSYVDQSRVAAHGHSMGAFVTTALVAAYPADFRCRLTHCGWYQVARDTRRPGAERGAGTQYSNAVSTAPWRPGRGGPDCAGSAS